VSIIRYNFRILNTQALRTIREQEVLTLNERAREVFVNALLHPSAPGRKLVAAARRYKKRAKIWWPKKQKQRGDFRVESLGKAHDRAAFSCGSEALDHYLKTKASQDIAKRVAACVVLTPDGKTVAGFYTLSQYSLDLVTLPDEIVKKLPKYPDVPAALVGRLAISERFRGQGLGEFLLLDALYGCFQHSKQVASAAVVVDAKYDAAKRFYEHFGFLSLPETPNRLFLPIKTIERLFPE
jgi:predicted GNAT family N-acyltransferase